ncbi:MAG: triose-phosphate isomerase [Actinobacteria bacterium]|nr:triose-phosphate isomerase [Actinomycetota bacterium]
MDSEPVRTAAPARRELTAPFFEIGPKNLLRLPDIVAVSVAAQAAGVRDRVCVILTVPTALIAPAKASAPDAFIFAQGMDLDDLGPSVGRVLPESLVDAGADGVMLNHDSNPLDPAQLRRSIRRAQDLGLMTMVCAGDEAEVLGLLPLHPTIVLFEPPELIGHAGGADRAWIAHVNAQARALAPDVLMMHAGGVGTPEDAYRIMRSGADGTGSTSGVLLDESPPRAAARFISAARRGFDDHKNRGEE